MKKSALTRYASENPYSGYDDRSHRSSVDSGSLKLSQYKDIADSKKHKTLVKDSHPSAVQISVVPPKEDVSSLETLKRTSSVSPHATTSRSVNHHATAPSPRTTKAYKKTQKKKQKENQSHPYTLKELWVGKNKTLHKKRKSTRKVTPPKTEPPAEKPGTRLKSSPGTSLKSSHFSGLPVKVFQNPEDRIGTPDSGGSSSPAPWPLAAPNKQLRKVYRPSMNRQANQSPVVRRGDVESTEGEEESDSDSTTDDDSDDDDDSDTTHDE